jgi:hypothetical protein
MEQACLHTLTGHTGYVTGVSLSSDGSTAVSGSDDTTVKVWSVAAGSCLHTLTGHTNYVSGVSLSSDGSTAVSGSGDKTVKVWSVAAGSCLHTLTGHTDAVRGVSLSSDGSTVVSGSFDKTVKVWSVAAGSCLHTLTGHTNYVCGVSLSSDGSTAVLGSCDKTVKVWQLEEPDGIDVSNVHEKSLEDLATLRERAAAKRDGITVTEGLDEAMADVGRRKADIQQTYERQRKELQDTMERDVQACDREAESLQALMKKESTERGKRQRLLQKVQVLDAQIQKREADLEAIELIKETAKAEYARAMQTAGRKIKADTLKYKVMYTDYLDAGHEATARNRLDDGVVASLATSAFADTSVPYCWKKTGVDFRQPDDAGDASQNSVKYAMDMRKAFANALPGHENGFKGLASRLDGVEYERGPPKKNERLFEKAEMYEGDLRRITDFERCSFVCDNFGGVLVVYNELFVMLEIVRVKNRFAKCNKTAKESGGYRDLQLVARLQSGLLLEIQVHLKAFYVLKTEVAGNEDGEGQSGHERYIDFRQLKEQATFNMEAIKEKYGGV